MKKKKIINNNHVKVNSCDFQVFIFNSEYFVVVADFSFMFLYFVDEPTKGLLF